MLLAPHPDDEALATCGVLQRACAVGARTRVLFLTDGENNPWAQRTVERRWRISHADRVRWGKRRREEALSALSCLGVPLESVRFLGYPDQRLCDLLMTGPEGVLSDLASEIAGWQPSILVDPNPADRHPDHGALAVLADFALARTPLDRPQPTHLRYLVHAPFHRARDSREVTLQLTESERDRKRRAILMHRSQLPLRGPTLLRFADPKEGFIPCGKISALDDRHPVSMCSMDQGELHVALGNVRRVGLGPLNLLVAIETGRGSPQRLILELPLSSRPVPVRDASTGDLVAVSSSSKTPIGRELVLPLAPALRPHLIFVKLDRPSERGLGFFDPVGWRPVPVVPIQRRVEAEDSAEQRVPVTPKGVPAFQMRETANRGNPPGV